jgi:hypothetical protein
LREGLEDNFASSEPQFAILDEEGAQIPPIIQNNRPYFLQEQQKKKNIQKELNERVSKKILTKKVQKQLE